MGKTKTNTRDLLNKVAGGLIILTGISLFYFLFFQGDPELSRGFLLNLLFFVSSIAFIVNGIYIFKLKKWAIVLAGIYGIFIIINSWYLLGISLFNFTNVFYFVLSFTPFIVIINWIVRSKQK